MWFHVDRPRGADFEYGTRVPDHTKITKLEEDNVYAVFVSYVEIYNNYVYDLLEEIEYDGVKPRYWTAVVTVVSI